MKKIFLLTWIIFFPLSFSAMADSCERFQEALENEDLREIKNLWDIYEFPANCLNQKNKRGMTALMLASYKGKFEMVQWLLELGVNLEAERWGEEVGSYEEGATALWLAVEEDHTDIAMLLLESGASVNVFLRPNRRSMLFLAILHDNMRLVDLLIKHGASLGDVSEDSLLVALPSAGSELTRYLIEKGLIFNSIDHVKLLHRAASEGNLYLVKVLIEQYRVSVDSLDEDGQTPFIMAAMSGEDDILRYLVERGANIFQVDDEQKNALMWASIMGRYDVVQTLLLFKSINVNERDDMKQTALMYAAQCGKIEPAEIGYVRYLFASRNPNDYADIITLLLQSKADPTLQNSNGKTAYDLAISFENRETFEALGGDSVFKTVPNCFQEGDFPPGF